MGEEENRKVIEQAQKSMEAGDYRGLEDLMHEDVVQEWPQSGERIRGKQNIKAINDAYPGMPDAKLRRITLGGDVVVAEMVLDYGGKTVHGCTILEMKDGKVVKETDYFADPFEAPEWRKQWVEKMEPAQAGSSKN